MVSGHKILITGASGFIGSHLTRYFSSSKANQVTALVRNNYAGSLSRLKDFDFQGQVFWKNLRDEFTVQDYYDLGKFDTIIHCAASSHVDRSIIDPRSFVLDNVLGTCNLLEYQRIYNNDAKLLYFSTDEVFGPAPQDTNYKEWDRYNSGNPYAATKAGAEELCLAYANTYKLDILITHTMNVFGELQHPEKFIPLCVKKILAGNTIDIHGSNDGIPGSRYYIYVKRVAEAVDFILQNGVTGEKYNIVGEQELSNLELAKTIAGLLSSSLNYNIVDYHSSRPGHDLRYALDGSKLKGMGFQFNSNFDKDLKRTVTSYG